MSLELCCEDMNCGPCSAKASNEISNRNFYRRSSVTGAELIKDIYKNITCLWFCVCIFMV